ncbi:hypothetical protein BH23ACT4_BH23ACT4_12440 [soil metagenome]
MTGTTPTAASVERLAIPEDDTAPDSPVVALAQSNLKASHPQVTSGADLLGSGHIGRAFGEEPLVLSFGTTASVILYLS